jgi:hypothetical protein
MEDRVNDNKIEPHSADSAARLGCVTPILAYIGIPFLPSIISTITKSPLLRILHHGPIDFNNGLLMTDVFANSAVSICVGLLALLNLKRGREFILTLVVASAISAVLCQLMRNLISRFAGIP